MFGYIKKEKVKKAIDNSLLQSAKLNDKGLYLKMKAQFNALKKELNL